MSESADREDRTEAPSPKRLKEAREKGDVPRSKELANVAVLGATVATLMSVGGFFSRASQEWMRNAMIVDPELLGHSDRILTHVVILVRGLMLPFAPILLIALAACFISPLAMGGLRFSTQALEPKLQRLSPMAWVKRVYGQEGLAELLRSLLRIVLIGAVGVWAMRKALNTMPYLQHMPLEQAIAEGLHFTMVTLAAMVGAMTLLAAADVPYQHWNWQQKLKMTKQEVRDEYKELEGNPQVKGKIRQLAREMSQRRMMEAVPTADVIITNPTHYAVALKYEAGKMRAPKVVALGVDEVALKIREIGQAHRVSTVEAPPLARALYRNSKLDEEIPVALYAAVAQVLSYIFQLRRWHPAHGPMPSLAAITVDPTLDDGQEPR